ncbi:hypothetical protein Rhopal_003716-T1 [Rhodotorula paludigena]|uniref:Fork-head domain-containing protein n=1 Tax=Rhodotorula paludigena TaxID=86838 RepID=A0AAV5GMW7_9BASI|nr:hypothetical protein Rhopal_003716-T1 [Rhodotorula paludigena]
MLGSPASAATALPSFALYEGSTHAVDDHDFLPSWSKTLSPSPRLGPTALSSGARAAKDTPTGLDLFGADLTVGRVVEDVVMSEAASKSGAPDVGTGLSPVLAPTHLATSPLPLASGADNEGSPVFPAQARSAFESSFSKFHQSPSAEASTSRQSPLLRRKSSLAEAPAPLSFANVANLPSLSPELRMAELDKDPFAADTKSPVRPARQLDGSASFAQSLPEGLQRRATLGGTQEARIQAYAKLEFPSFDIYIQKLSVIIGRRPAAPPASPAFPVLPLDDARSAGMSLEDYILSLTSETPAVKKEETLATIDPNTPAPAVSPKGKEKAVDDPFSEFVQSSPPPASYIAASAPLAPASTASAVQPAAPCPAQPVEAPAPLQTDVDLGPLRAVSRQHARLYFDYDAGSWAVEVLGRNGVVVEGKWRAKGQKVLLVKKTKIQIAERIFYFVLPTIDVVAVGADGKPEPVTSPEKAKARTKQRSSGKVSSKNKSGAADDDLSSSLSEVSDSDVEAVQPTKSSSTTAAAPAAAAPSADASVATASALPPLPPAGKTASRSSATPKPRPPLPSKAPATRSSKKPKPPLKEPSPPARHSALDRDPRASPVIDADELEAARRRAAMVAQLLGGAGGPNTNAALVRAAAEAQRRLGGKGKAPMRSAGKGPGKGKSLPPRSRRPSWDADEEDKSSSSDSDDDDEEPDAEGTLLAALDADLMDVDEIIDMVGSGHGGGKHLVKRSGSVSLEDSPVPASAPAPAVPASAGEQVSAPPIAIATTPAAPAAPAPAPPKTGGKMPAKQPRKRRGASLSGASAAKPPVSTPAAAPAPARANLSSALPPLSALPALPTLSPAPPTPATLSTSSLPPLPPLKAAAASPAPAGLPALPKTTAAPIAPAATSSKPLTAPAAAKPAPAAASPAPGAAPVPAKKPKSHKKKPTKAEVAAAAAAGTGVAPDKANGDKTAGDKAAAGAKGAAAGEAGAAPVKPRPSPYAPAPLPPGVPPPDAAPADNPTAKPPYTYASLIAQAIATSEAKKLTLHEVYDWIGTRWPFFPEGQSGWQNSIRHNLTPARGFLKVVRRADEPGKGSFWEIDPTQMGSFDGHHFRVKRAEGAPAAGGSSSSKAKAAAAAAAAAASGAGGASPSPSPAIAAAVDASTNTTAKVSGAAPPAPARPSASPAPSGSSTAANNAAALAKPLPIVVSLIPDSYVRPTPPPESASAAAKDDLTAALMENPPIVLHEGTLVISPEIFGNLTKSRLDELQKMPASKALQILQAQVVQHFKEKMRKKSSGGHKGGSKASAKRARESDAGLAASTSSAPPKPAKVPKKAPKKAS